MLSTRKVTVYTVIVLAAIYLLTHFRQGLVFHYDSIFPSATKQYSDGKFRWADVPIKYPANHLTQLPSAKPQKLPKVQFDFPEESEAQAAKRKERQAAVEATFLRCWNAYKDQAWMRDEVTPITGNYKDGFGGWAATLVDSLDTLWMMGLKNEFENAVAAVVDIDLGKSTTETVNVFETNIRHLGGLLAAYDLSADERLLKKAREFGDMLLKSFDTPNRMPVTRWKPHEALQMRKQEADTVVLVAEIGSLTMEFTRLSQITQDPKWYDAVNNIMQRFVSQLDETHLPGMFPVVVNARNADFTQDTFFTLSAMADSFYEYLPKMHALLGGVDPIYAKLYSRTMQTAIKHNLFKPMTPDEADILVAGNVKAEMAKPPKLEPQGQHLGCFAGGMFALGGRIFRDEEHVKIGRQLTDGCTWAYKAGPMGIMPEVFHMVPCPSRTGECKWDEQKWKDAISQTHEDDASADVLIQELRLPKGFTNIGDRRYILRPEAIESVFILYRITGDEALLETAWEMFQAIVSATETPIANAALSDVTYSKDEVDSKKMQVKMDSMESFWLAETLKYFYLIFSEPSLISLDEFVFNTEAHCFRRPLAG